MKQHINLLRLIATISVIFIHVGSLFISSQNLTEVDSTYFIYEYFHRFFSYAVPIFLLLSGALLLNPHKEISYKSIFHKYIPRILRSLVIFGLPMSLLEFLVNGGGNLISCVLEFFTGHSWTHMWYLYMLIGLYALTPLYKVYINNVSNSNVQTLLGVLGVMGVVLPFIDMYLIPVSGYIILPVFLFLYPCGYYVDALLNKSKMNMILSSFILFFYIIYITKTIAIPTAFGCDDLVTILFSIAIFHLSKYVTIKKSSILEFISKHCFCIYIVHAIFLNVFFKVLHVEKILTFEPFFNVMIVSFITFTLSLVLSLFLHKIPYMRDKVL